MNSFPVIQSPTILQENLCNGTATIDPKWLPKCDNFTVKNVNCWLYDIFNILTCMSKSK